MAGQRSLGKDNSPCLDLAQMRDEIQLLNLVAIRFFVWGHQNIRVGMGAELFFLFVMWFCWVFVHRTKIAGSCCREVNCQVE